MRVTMILRIAMAAFPRLEAVISFHDPTGGTRMRKLPVALLVFAASSAPHRRRAAFSVLYARLASCRRAKERDGSLVAARVSTGTSKRNMNIINNRGATENPHV
jgi:hypothetical protein